MCRPPREFRAAPFELEGRLLLATVPTSTPVNSATVQFEGTAASAGFSPVQVVTQQAGEATVRLSRSNTAGSLQVQVTTAPYDSPWGGNVVGVNVGAVNQTVTFADGQGQATVTVPILPGAPNPGVVDVALDVTPLGPSTNVTNAWPLDLKVVASAPTLAPKVVSTLASSQGIVVSFNKPMNPVAASNVSNYAVSLVNFDHHTFGGILGFVLGATRTSASVNSVRLQSAQYDPATQSVTLIPKQRHLNVSFMTTVTQVHPARRSVRPGHPSNVAQGLTDLQGNPINGDTTPGKVELRLKNPNIGFGL